MCFVVQGGANKFLNFEVLAKKIAFQYANFKCDFLVF